VNNFQEKFLPAARIYAKHCHWFEANSNKEKPMETKMMTEGLYRIRVRRVDSSAQVSPIFLETSPDRH